MSELKQSAQRVYDALVSSGVITEIIEFEELTRTAQEAADALGCSVDQIAKTLIFKGIQTGKPVCVIASGGNRVDTKRVAQYVGEDVKKADASYVLEQTGFSVGEVSPVGFLNPLEPLIDEDLIHYDTVWAAAGTHHSVFSISPQELVRITGGRVVALKQVSQQVI